MNRPMDDRRSDIYVLECECGWVGEGAEHELIDLARVHGRDVHKFEPTPEQILAAARPRS